MQKIIGNKASIFEIQTQAKKDGMVTMEQDGILKAIKGITTVGEVLKSIKE
jgi:type II secretory ATPase GspE/PulE/Tfp pilus assembly ATPase PilB-like protein